MSRSPRALVAGIGNIFFGDDGFGVAVAQRLAEVALPPDVRAADFGIRGMHLAFEILDLQPALTILVDAVPRGGAPGTIYVLEPEMVEADLAVADAHGMNPQALLQLLARLEASPGRLLVVGCEPLTADEGIGLSAPVAAAVDEAVRVVLDLLDGVDHGCQDGVQANEREVGA